VRVTAHELEVFLTSLETGTAAGAAGNTERVERASASGSVVIREGARKATGDRAEYFPDTGRLQLFGNLAAISDPEGNRTQGARLTYFIGDGRISVDGEPGSPTEAWWRIHP
jgi:lipopolysaccharide export system protein LptA